MLPIITVHDKFTHFFFVRFIQLLFRKYGWDKDMYNNPKYRRNTKSYDFDDYASKGSAVHHTKKYNRNLEGREAEPQTGPEPGLMIECE